MANRGFLTRHRIVRGVFQEDLLYFGLPAIFICIAGLAVSARDGLVELPGTMWNLSKQPQSIALLSVPNFVGIFLFVSRFVILLIAHFTLGRFHSSTLIIREDHRLITHGIYHLTRHPIYLGVLMVSIGLPVYASSLYGLLIMSALILVFLIRIRIEERLLIKEFGDDYQTYKRATSKLMPFIY
jgi:protein-S-isoprenylcysteine O-methyltransferase Ste14